MKNIKIKAKTVDDAVEEALSKLGVKRDNAKIKIIDEGSKGIFGLIGAKDAVVEVEKVFKPIDEGKLFLENLIEKANLEIEVEVVDSETDEEQVQYNLKGQKELGLVIGHRGETLDAIQYLTSIYINKELDDYFRVLVDAEGYRDRRRQTLERLADRLADKAKRKQRKVVLEPMPPHERRIIHIKIKEKIMLNPIVKGKSLIARL